MPTKRFRLILTDLGFYVTGRADVRESRWRTDPWLYPLDWTYQLDREHLYFEPRDSVGIPMVNLEGQAGPRYLVSRIAGYGFAHWNRWREDGNSTNRIGFLQVADWFLDRPDGIYRHDYAVAGMPVNWISCISQGEAASILARAFILTGEQKYADRARQAIEPLMTPVEDGGLQSRLPRGGPFLEEYPGTIYRHVLNGCLYAIVGIHDAIRVGDEADHEPRRLFAALITSLGDNLDAWDQGGWSTYDMALPGHGPRNLNTMTYQRLTAGHLHYLAAAGGDERLEIVARRWDSSAERLGSRLAALLQKLSYRAVSGW